MGSATIVPEEILESAKGRNVTIELKMNGYAWIINGRDITASDIKDINLEVNAGVQNIFEAYQSDFDQGRKRDSAYIYGPAAPRSYFAGVKISY